MPLILHPSMSCEETALLDYHILQFFLCVDVSTVLLYSESELIYLQYYQRFAKRIIQVWLIPPDRFATTISDLICDLKLQTFTGWETVQSGPPIGSWEVNSKRHRVKVFKLWRQQKSQWATRCQRVCIYSGKQRKLSRCECSITAWTIRYVCTTIFHPSAYWLLCESKDISVI